MRSSMGRRAFVYFLTQLLVATTAYSLQHGRCKAAPSSFDWPSASSWAALNQSLSGRLLKPAPPGAPCHPDQPAYDAATCPAVQAGFLTAVWHTENPVSTLAQNLNNNSCLPGPAMPCSGAGYPVYVINATSPEDVKKGIDFARKKNVRLIVKGTGHCSLGRSIAPNCLSIWTHNIQGISFQDGFRPKGCRYSIDGPAVTAAAGMQMLDIDREASLRNLVVVGGGSGSVGIGGFITGGGHGAFSHIYGLGADQVLEIEMVTPRGSILTINECQHQDLFWAMRGGGGSTFGVITSVTIKAFPSPPFTTSDAFLGTVAGTDDFYEVAASILAQYTSINDQGISAYLFIVPNISVALTGQSAPGIPNSTLVDIYYGTFTMPFLHPENTTASFNTAVNNVFKSATAPYPGQFLYSVTPPNLYANFYDWYLFANGPPTAGSDWITGSRLLDEKALTSNRTALINALKASNPPGQKSPPTRQTQLFPVAGKGVRDAVPRGGSNAVNPAWRIAVSHTIVISSWQPFDTATQTSEEYKMTNNYIEALRELAPDTGAYINEADPNEPDFQQAFWGDNYARLLAIKRAYDPCDVFWCRPCVGNERWMEVGSMLCRIDEEVLEDNGTD